MAGSKGFSFILLILILGGSYELQAQERYRTVEGKVQVHGRGKNGGLIARSNQLFVRVDHETGDLFMKLDQRTLHTGVDSIDRRLDTLPDEPIIFQGRLKRGGFNPNQCYSATPLRIQGTMSYRDKEWDLTGKGEFKSRFSNARIPCLIEIGFEIDLGDLQQSGFLPGFKEDVHIRILQALLNPQM